MRGTGRTYQRGDVWWIEYWHRGKQYRESTGLRGKRNEGAARRILRAKTGEIAQGTFQAEAKITVDQVLDDFEKDYRLRGGGSCGSCDPISSRCVRFSATSKSRTSQNGESATTLTRGLLQ